AAAERRTSGRGLRTASGTAKSSGTAGQLRQRTAESSANRQHSGSEEKNSGNRRQSVNLLLAEVAQATQRLADAGVPSPRLDGGELAAYVPGVGRGELHPGADADFDARYWEGVARREAREPLQHITGRAFFRYLELQVGPGVFVPRPETESMVAWAIDAV